MKFALWNELLSKSAIAILLCITACQPGTQSKVVKDAQGNVTEKYAVDAEGKKTGTYQRFNAQKVLLEEANYIRDTLHGPRKLYYPSGTLNATENYEMGQFIGPYKAYHENGKLMQDGVYQNNSMEGIWKTYYTSGLIKEEVMFHENLENGPFKEYFENGKLKAEGTYQNGDQEQGELLLYDSTGTLIKKMQCDRGVCRTSWTAK